MQRFYTDIATLIFLYLLLGSDDINGLKNDDLGKKKKMNCWVSGSVWLNQSTNSEWDTTGRIDKIQRQTEATKNKTKQTNKKTSLGWLI